MSDNAPPTAAKLGLVAALLLIVASALVWDIVYRGPRSASASLPPPDRLLVLSLGAEAPPGRTLSGRSTPASGTPTSGTPESGESDARSRRGQPSPLEGRSQEPRTEDRRYQVREGQCLYNIAVEVYGSGDRWPEIARENDLSDPFLLREGQILRIPR